MTASLTDAELLSRLVAFDTTSIHSNLPMAEFVCDYLDGKCVEILRNFNDDKSKVNLLIRVAGRQSDPGTSGLMLSGHMDTVPAGEPEWKSDPFTLVETQDAFFGRGTCDMKGFVALAVNSLKKASGHRLQCPLAVLLTFDEEPGILGAQHFARTWRNPLPLPRNVVVGEPTELCVVRMHKGHLKMRVTLRGRSAHTAYPQLGVNAIEPAGRVITALAALRRDFEQIRSETSRYYPDTPFVTLTIAMIHGGTATNVVPDRCVVDFGLRLLPDMNAEDLAKRVRAKLETVDGLGDHGIEVTGLSAPFFTKEESEICRKLCTLVGQSETHAVSYASDAGPLQQMGLHCVLYGPGSIEVAHKPNEWLPKRDFLTARETLDRLVEMFCLP
jgi:acetylornithine deacetylase